MRTGTSNRRTVSSSRTTMLLLLRTLSTSTMLLLLLLLLLHASSSSSFSWRVHAFGSQNPQLVLSSSSSTSRSRRSRIRTSRLFVSSTTPGTARQEGIKFFHNHTLLSASSFFQSSSDEVWSKNDEDHTTTDKSSRPLLIQKQEEEEDNENDGRSGLLFRQLQSAAGVLPSVVSSALLITGSTFGAGSLVLPELAQGAGLANTFALFLVAYIMNLISGLCIAQVAIQQKIKLDMEAASAAATLSSSSTSLGDSQEDGLEQRQQSISLKKKKNADAVVDVPCSFKEFVESTTGSHALASFISAVSFGVNSLVWAFVLSRVGILASQFTTTMTHDDDGLVAALSSSSVASTLWAAGLVLIFATQTPGRISHGASVFVTPALFASFASLLVPGLAAVPDDFITGLSQPGLNTMSSDSSSLAALAPVVYMSTIYQNVVPTVAKLQNYHPTRTMVAIVLGSAMPLVMYLLWCYTCLSGGIDLEALTTGGSGGGGMVGPLLTVFSLATLAGSSIGLGLSCASEINTFVKATLHGDNKNNQDNDNDRFPLPTVLASVGLPLLICQVFGHGGQADLTGALSLAGGLGSPLLYGIIPVVMVLKQSQQQQQQQKLDSQTAAQQHHTTKSDSSFTFLPAFLRQHNSNTNNKVSLDVAKQMDASTTKTASFVPASSLGVLGVFSTGMLGSEIVGQVSQVLASAAATAGTSTVVVPVAAVVEQVGEMAMVAMAAAPL